MKNLAAVLTPAEVGTTIDPLQAAAAALRQGVATEQQWQMVASAANVADAIEEQGVVRGLAEHFRSADLALEAIARRALDTGAWQPPTLHLQEVDQVTLLVELHEYQLQHLSFGEYRRAIARALNQTRAGGGRVVTGRDLARAGA